MDHLTCIIFVMVLTVLLLSAQCLKDKEKFIFFLMLLCTTE